LHYDKKTVIGFAAAEAAKAALGRLISKLDGWVGSLATSTRIRGGKAVTHAAITETPFDCCDDLMVKPGKLSMKDISTIPFMAQFGRPL